VLGHVYPVQLGFRGGKGIATTLGAMLVADPLVALAACGGALLFLLVLRRPALAGSLGVAALPVVGAAMDRSGPMFQGLFALTVLITVAHKNEINDYIRSWNRNEPGG
jgi:glycerol-3-phosphate acyltransferase PlsY